MNFKVLALDASENYESEWQRQHQHIFAIEFKCTGLDAVDAEVYLEYAFEKSATVGIEIEGSRQTLDAADKHICIRNEAPLNSDWIRFVYVKGSNTEGTIDVRGNV